MSVCRISVQPTSNGGCLDVTVNACVAVGELLPALVDALGHRPTVDVVNGWRLDRIAGAPLEEALSLRANGVCDGDVLVLGTIGTPAAGPTRLGPERVVAAVAEGADVSDWSLRQATAACAAVVAAIALQCNGSTPLTLAVAVTCAIAMAGAALATRSDTVAVSGCVTAAVAGSLAVPAGPGVPNAFLGACAALAVAVILARSWPHPSAALIATTSVAALTACVTGVATVATLPATTVGTLLTVTALVLLTGAPRLAAGLAVREHARAAHTTLTGLVIGSVAGVVTGIATVALQCTRDGTAALAGSALGLATAACLLLRIRTFVDGPRRVALLAGGSCCGATVLAVTVSVRPDLAAWAAAAALAAGLLGLRRTWPALAGRGADVADGVALATVVPLGCWVIGAYGLVRDWMP